MEGHLRAVHRTIVVVDVEGFGDRRRTNRHQVAVRQGLYRALREAFTGSGIAWADCDRADRGDGVFIEGYSRARIIVGKTLRTIGVPT